MYFYMALRGMPENLIYTGFEVELGKYKRIASVTIL